MTNTEKATFSKNLKKYMDVNQKSRNDICRDLGFNYYTVTDWINGKKMPRMDKITALANYFGILKSDLIEEKTPEHQEMKKNSEAIADLASRMLVDANFFSLVNKLSKLDESNLQDATDMLNLLFKQSLNQNEN